MMSARLLRYTPPEKQGRFYRSSERVFERIIAFYGRTLKFVLGYRAGNPPVELPPRVTFRS
jgi:multidrug efflux pump